MRRFWWEGSVPGRGSAARAGLLVLLGACATDEGASEPRGEVILRVQVSARDSGAPVAGATIRLFADYERRCVQQGPLTAELVTDAGGALRLQAEGPRLDGGTCFSLSAVAPPGSSLAPAERVTFILEFRAGLPLDSTQVDVMLATVP